MDAMLAALKKAGGDHGALHDKDAAHLVIQEDEVTGSHLVPGLLVDVKKKEPGLLDLKMTVKERIERPVHLCFGVLANEGRQTIHLDLSVLDRAKVDVMAHCLFPEATDVVHTMDAKIHIGRGGHYTYEESHYHGQNGGVHVDAKARIVMEEESYLKTLFSLVEGRVGTIEIDYESQVMDRATLEMIARISGFAKDTITIREAANLLGEDSRGVLESRVAIRDEARAEIINEVIASAPGAWGHVECTEILKDNAIARAVPLVEVRHPQAKVTHEAALGSVDNKQLQTLMARGLNEERAVEVIIQGLLHH